jgi:hypothetical protein
VKHPGYGHLSQGNLSVIASLRPELVLYWLRHEPVQQLQSSSAFSATYELTNASDRFEKFTLLR